MENQNTSESTVAVSVGTGGLLGGFGIVANVGEPDSFLRLGAKCWIVGGTGGEGWHKFRFLGMTRSGRMVEKWCVVERFENFRAAFIPPPVRAKYPERLYIEGTRSEMEEIAKRMTAFRADLRPLKPKPSPNTPVCHGEKPTHE